MIEGIAFDLWNTLARNVREPDPMRLLARALGIQGDPGWARRIERGMMLAPAGGIEGALRQLEEREGLAIADPAARREVVERWSRVADDVSPFADVLPALGALAGRYRLGLISNTQSFGLEFLEREGLWGLLDASALSFEVGALKPRREIFLALAARLGLAPDKLLMVGDHPVDDVAGARAAGMHALRVERPGTDPSRYPAPGPAVPVLTDLTRLPDRIAALRGRA